MRRCDELETKLDIANGKLIGADALKSSFDLMLASADSYFTTSFAFLNTLIHTKAVTPERCQDYLELLDANGNTCDHYTNDPDDCSNNDIELEFEAASHCCACGGGRESFNLKHVDGNTLPEDGTLIEEFKENLSSASLEAYK